MPVLREGPLISRSLRRAQVAYLRSTWLLVKVGRRTSRRVMMFARYKVRTVATFSGHRADEFSAVQDHGVTNVTVPEAVLRSVSNGRQDRRLFFRSFPVSVTSQFNRPFQDTLFQTRRGVIRVRRVTIRAALRRDHRHNFTQHT